MKNGWRVYRRYGSCQGLVRLELSFALTFVASSSHVLSHSSFVSPPILFPSSSALPLPSEIAHPFRSDIS